MSGKSGESGPTATPLAHVPENPEPEPAQLPCSAAKTVSVTKLRRLHALVAAAQTLCHASERWSLLFNHLVKMPQVQVSSLELSPSLSLFLALCKACIFVYCDIFCKNGNTGACSTADCCPLLSIAVHCCPLLPIIAPLLPIVAHCCPLLPIVAHCCPLLPIVTHCCPL